MGFIGAVRSEFVKVKHTPFWAIHFCLPIVGALLFVAYYVLYRNVEDDKKLKLILELAAMGFPLLISVIVGLNIMQEEKASHFQTLLAMPSRGRIVFAKLAALYGMGVLALFCLFFLFLFEIHMFGIDETVQLPMLAWAVMGIAFANLIIYLLHLFLSLKFGLGISLFWGVFESLQGILYSNVKLQGMARYIPFAWSMNWIRDVLHGELLAHMIEWAWIAIASLVCFFLALAWISHWEGRW